MGWFKVLIIQKTTTVKEVYTNIHATDMEAAGKQLDKLNDEKLNKLSWENEYTNTEVDWDILKEH